MPLLPSRAKFRKDELLQRRNNFASFFPFAWLWTAQREEPLGLTALPQVKLRAAKMGFEAPRILHCFNLLVIRRESDGVF